MKTAVSIKAWLSILASAFATMLVATGGYSIYEARAAEPSAFCSTTSVALWTTRVSNAATDIQEN